MSIMKPFIQVAQPHKDVLEGKLTMDIFAADLWQVFTGKAPDEYKNPHLFFQKTHLTEGLNNILEIARKRLNGKGGDPVIQLQTPFGGGKTHTLIALYHKAKEWNANVVVIDGTALDPKDTTLWEEIERQLTGKVEKLKGKTSPGKDKLINLLENKQPVLILLDEILEYSVKSAGIEVGKTTLASQTLAFMQEITGAVSALDKSLLIFTLPSSLLEHYDENAEKLFQRLQKITGREEKLYAPVKDDEVPLVIRKRLFASVDEISSAKTIEEFLTYAEKEEILPVDKSVYREKFLKSYPFQPEVIDVLYKRWGSFPSFQRTRGVLRILALVVYSLKNSKIPFIRLSDFDLKNDELRRELVKHIGQEFDSVIYSDITSPESGAKKVDKSLGSAYSSYYFGTKCATTIFMYSFSGAGEKGATINEVKLSSVELSAPSSIIAEAINKLRENLFYLADRTSELYFTNQPNLNRLIFIKSENISEREIYQKEKEILQKSFGKDYFLVLIWPSKTNDVPDDPRLKLVVLQNSEKIKEIFEYCGEKPRVYRNTLIFVCPSPDERNKFDNFIRRKIAFELIENDKSIKLSDEQKKMLKDELKKAEQEFKTSIRDLYRIIYLPRKNEFKEIDMGIHTHGVTLNLDKEIYDKLESDGEIIKKLHPNVILKRYLGNKNYLNSKQLLDTFYRTPGEILISGKEVLENSIREGVKEGLFGIGKLEDNKVICLRFKEPSSPEFSEDEIIIKPDLCKKPPEPPEPTKPPKDDDTITKALTSLYLKLSIPHGKVSDFARIIYNAIQKKFKNLRIIVEVFAENGEIDKNEYDKIKEGLDQAGIEIIEERTKSNPGETA